MNIKLFKFLFNIFIFFVFISVIVYAKSDGKIGTTKKNGDGCHCHGDLNTEVQVEINGPSEMKVNETADFSITITGGPLKTGGINVAVSSGELKAGLDTFIKHKELTHTEPKEPIGGKIIFDFKYQAPDKPGEVTIFANWKQH